MDLAASIEQLFDSHGDRTHTGADHLPVTARAHALQCALRAEWAGADAPLVLAALLHDVGHFIGGQALPSSDDHDGDDHDLRAVLWLRGHLPADVVEPIRLHVQAKRYLLAVEPEYRRCLVSASLASLLLQGGPMCDDECRLFESLPYATQALALRRWDDAAHAHGVRTPPLAYYLDMLDGLLASGAVPERVSIA